MGSSDASKLAGAQLAASGGQRRICRGAMPRAAAFGEILINALRAGYALQPAAERRSKSSQRQI